MIITFYKCYARAILLSCIALFCYVAATAQNTGSIRGVVQDENGNPVPNSSVVITNPKSSLNKGTITDSLGNFQFQNLPADGNYKITVSNVQYENLVTQEYNFKQNSSLSLSLKLKSRSDQLNEVIVVGYGTQKKANLTGAVSQVSGEVFENRSIPNITQGLQGTIPNLNLIMADGKPITSPTYNVRGTTSIGQGGSALVLIDGVQGDPSLLNPNDVASVTVLKDVTSAAIYGARAAYGVVLITTKSPKKNKFNINFSTDYSIKKPTAVPDVVTNGYEYAVMFDTAWTAWNDYATKP